MMENMLERLYEKKRARASWAHATPSLSEELAYEFLLQNLTDEQKKYLSVYERWREERIEELKQEIFIEGFHAGCNQNIELLKLHLNRD